MTKELQIETIRQVNSFKTAKLIFGIIFDLIGMFPSVFLPIAIIMDPIWAPFSAFIMTRMYKGNVGRIAGVIDFVEELFPFIDVIPTFTLTWIYVYIIKKEK